MWKAGGRGIFKAIELIEAAGAVGQDVTVDFYPFDGGSATLVSLLPPTLMDDAIAETLRALSATEGSARGS